MPNNDIELKTWHVYLVKIPYFDNDRAVYLNKVRPCILYKKAGDDIVCLTITSNQNEDGTRKKEPNHYQVEVRLGKYGLVKVNQPISVSKKAVIKYKCTVPMNIRRKIIVAWNKLMNWPLIK